MNVSRHCLVVGGSGMLQGLCLSLAARGDTVSVIARRAGRLRALADLAASGKGTIHPLALDYRDTVALVEGLRGALQRHGPVALAVCWIHRTAPEAPFAVAETLDGHGIEVLFIRVLGGASRRPGGPEGAGLQERIARLRHVGYREVLLGYAREGGASRWLTDAEICEGILAAIDRDGPRHVVGALDPWDLRPR